MKPHIAQFAALFAMAGLAAAPVGAKPPASEIELHIEASAQVPPDRARVPVTLTGYGETEAAARADLDKNREAFLASLSGQGLDRALTSPLTSDAQGRPVVTFDDEAADAAACAAAAAASDAAMSAAQPRKRGKTKVDDYGCKDEPLVTAHTTLLVETADLSKVDQIKLPAESAPVASYGRNRPVFSQSDPAAARAKARKQALAKARAEADAYAETMGYRVVRTVRVSNARPPVNLPDLFGLFAAMDNRGSTMQPSWFSATTVETVAIDYVIAPK
ncbi:MAG: SIMPL domain-containing protein [Novosphingobium sp.]